ncbi:MAG: 4-hydroxy-3-methylbut-2-enyl diphosphate reductase [Clostridiales bacterium]|nr:4-hydroxy-3-methylbut-2-enyl diphosphate reductase [Clostridiales bacterium]
MIKISPAKYAGFCSGVDRAVELAFKAGEGAKVYGSLVHNKEVTDRLKDKGIEVIDDLSSVKTGDKIIIRAHGATKEDIALLKDKGAKIIDATCPFVYKIHKILDEKTDNVTATLFVGEKEHAEVKAAVTYAHGPVYFYDECNIENISENKIIVVFQTTFSQKLSEKIKEIIEKSSKHKGKTVEFFDTICYTTQSRQEEAIKLARTHEAVVVVGDKTSSNTNRLLEAAKSFNENVFLISKADELPSQIKQFWSIAVLAGASTPPWLFTEVLKVMGETQKIVNSTENESVIKEEATSQTKAKAETKASKKSSDEITMADIIASDKMLGFAFYTPGKRVKCTVISADDNGIKVALGGKKDGFIDKSEASVGAYNPADYKDGDVIEAVILSTNKDTVMLSKRVIDQRKAEDEAAEKAFEGVFTLEMTEVVKGGLRGKLGSYTVFVPASQITTKYVKNLEDYKGKKLRLMVMPPKAKAPVEGEVEEEKPKKKSKYVFASQRMVIEKEKKEREDAFWGSIHVNDIVKGKVKRFTEFGAFVNVRGFDCLCHISEISWNKVADPASILKIGESYDFIVLKVDRESNKISLGFKQLQKKPYELAAEKYPVGSIITGKVERIFPYGAFVSIDEGVDGLVHVSQISHKWIKDASEALKIGDEVTAKVISFEDNRITLSIKELLPPPEEVEVDKEQEKERSKKTAARLKKFEENLEKAEKKDKRARNAESEDEPREWHSNSGGTTLGELLKNLDLNFDIEEKETKKTSKKKVSE